MTRPENGNDDRTQPGDGYERLRRADRELGGPGEFVVRPVEEDEQVAAAAADEAPAPELTLEWQAGLERPAARAPRLQGRHRAGDWPSPVTPAMVAQAVGLRTVAVDANGAVWWRQSHPADGGLRLVRGDGYQWYELEGPDAGEAVAVRDGLVVAGRLDGRLYLLGSGRTALPLTAEPAQPFAERYTDLVAGPDGREVWCVRESGAAGMPQWSLVAVPVDGSGTVRTLISSDGPLSSPRPSPDGALLAWVEWDRPLMPWDGSRLRVGRLGGRGGVRQTWTVLGGPVESVFQPEWASPDSLYVVSDRTLWWNLYEVWLDSRLRPLYLAAEEFGWPQRGPGLATYGRLADGRLAVLHGSGEWRLDLLDPEDGTLAPLDLPFAGWQPSLRASGSMIAGVAGGPTLASAVVVVDASSGRHRVLQRAAEPPPEALPECHPVRLAAADGHEVRMTVYPPRHPQYRPDPGERLPYLLMLPDGPGSQATRILDPATVMFTGSGFGVAVVEVRGSSGYGRRYREQVYGRWGSADVEDCAAAARVLVQQWGADPDRLVVRGGGAGGTLALAALANTDLFAAAAVHAPVADPGRLPATSAYAVGEYLRAIAADSAAPRSAAWLSRISRPVLMLHGEQDGVVPIGQTELLRDALERQGVPHTCLIFPGEGHVMRRADSVSRALEAELSFYADVLGRRLVAPGWRGR